MLNTLQNSRPTIPSLLYFPFHVGRVSEMAIMQCCQLLKWRTKYLFLLGKK